MIIRPAIDIRDGDCVQLVGGDYNNELLRIPDPVKVAQDWIEKGFNNLHIIDLDRATNSGTNIEVVKQIANLKNDYLNLNIRVGGGVRSESDIDELVSAGVDQIIVGTKAVKEPDWFVEMATKYSTRLCVALEVFEMQLRIDGWKNTSSQSLEDMINRFNGLNIGSLLVTAIHVEGKRQGTDLSLFTYICSLTDLPVIASGGVTTIDDINILDQIGVVETVLGAAIYTIPELVKELQADQS